MKCNFELLSLYIDDDLPEALKEEVSSHLKECEECKKKIQEMKFLVKEMNNFEEVEPLLGYEKRLLSRLQEIKSKEKINIFFLPFLKPALLAASILLVVLLSYSYLFNYKISIVKKDSNKFKIANVENSKVKEKVSYKEEKIKDKSFSIKKKKYFVKKITKKKEKKFVPKVAEKPREENISLIPPQNNISTEGILKINLKAPRETMPFEVEINLPDGVAFIDEENNNANSRTLTWKGELNKEQPYVLAIPIRILKEGEFKVITVAKSDGYKEIIETNLSKEQFK